MTCVIIYLLGTLFEFLCLAVCIFALVVLCWVASDKVVDARQGAPVAAPSRSI